MSEFIPIDTPGGKIWAEIEGNLETEGYKDVADVDEVFRRFQDVVQALKENAQYLYEQLLSLAPSEVEINFGITVGAEAGVPLFGLAKASGEANYTLKMTWSVSEQDRAD